MQKIDKGNLEAVVKDFLDKTKDVLEWKWDNRFSTALAEFAVADQDGVKEHLAGFFGPPWDTNNIIGASPQVKAIDYLFGSLMYGQQLLTSDPDGSLILYCMWWPWGNGERVSIRVAVYYGEDEDKDAQAAKLREMFHLS